MTGYWQNPEATAETLLPGGWLRTGDAGFLDADRYLFITDRIKDMIVSGGENIYSAEVENILMSHPAIADVTVRFKDLVHLGNRDRRAVRQVGRDSAGLGRRGRGHEGQRWRHH